jgi:peroxiredoxin
MIQEGEKAPDFTLMGTEGDLMSESVETGDIERYSLSEATEGGYAVLNFYVNDFSPGCTEQVCDVRDIDLFQFEEGLSIFGISPDGVYSHDKFHGQNGLSYPLLSDPGYEVAEKYGVLTTTEDGMPMVRRSVFLVDDEEKVRYAWSAEDNREGWSTEPLSEMKDRLDEIRG